MVEKSDLDLELIQIIKSALDNPGSKNGRRVFEIQELFSATQDVESALDELKF